MATRMVDGVEQDETAEEAAWRKRHGKPKPPGDALDAPAVPTVSLYQLRMQLATTGALDAVEKGMAALPELSPAVQAWRYAPAVPRDSMLARVVVKLAKLTAAQADELWRAAGGIGV